MKREGLLRRNHQEANDAYFSGKKASYQMKADLTPVENELKVAAVMLYWAEGAKTGGTVDLANSDPAVIQVFLDFLRSICQIDEQRLRVYMYAFANQDIDSIQDFWSSLLQIPKDKFIKPYLQKKFDRTKSHKMPHGLVHLRYHDKKLLIELEEQRQIICRRLLN